MITVSNASFGYGNQPILSEVNLSIEPGEFIGLIGPNGAGKSTLFKGLLKLLPTLSGEVRHAPDLLRRIGYVPQRDTLDPIYPLTAWDVVRMGFEGPQPWYRGVGKNGKAMIQSCLEKVGMDDFNDHPFAQLSGGQRQRVLMARALAGDPKLLVLDEPTAGIDPVAEESVLNLLSALHKDHKLTILMVSHHIQSLRRCVQRAIVVNQGHILSGPAAELLAPERLQTLLEGVL
jgi:ABC-type Mn2+/Zn2+ transport system ATPase subunit